ncbi:CU044_5270 family protein [Streptomyces sp. NRRL B-1347]|uniref:CU044_5270 family protein n=1 Tax=Streptomyces sp. NRRL B-1347 TaxID=1476877 RepID=UPI0004C4FBB1|nr:CU044_5270 family protein [Streptomyces sp. NRRL B-1347]
MTDELDLLRAADPVSATEGPWRDRPLDARAERGLNQLLHTSRRRARRRVVLWAEAAVVALAAALVLTLPDLAATSATAAPSALRPRAGSAAVPLAEVAERAAAAARDGEPELRRGSHIQTWSLAMDAGPHAERPVTLPEEREVRWRGDGSRTERVETGGDLVSERVYPPTWADAPPRARPPHTPGKLRSYLTDTYEGGVARASGPLTADHLLDALPQLLDSWTLGARERAALVRVLADTKGLRPAGAITDRLGRPGQAYVYESKDPADEALRRMLILDPGTGDVLGLEVMFTEARPQFAVRAGDVMSYSAWRRD